MSVRPIGFLLAVSLLLGSSAAFAQTALPPSPVPVAGPPAVAPPVPPPGEPPSPAPLLPPQSAPATWPQPAPVYQSAPIYPPAPSTGLADPIPNGWGPAGLAPLAPYIFVGLELEYLKPVFKNQLQGTVALTDGTSNTLTVERSDLNWVVSPRFELGYKLPEGVGEFLIGYRFLASDGTQTQTANGDLAVKSRLNMNVIDLDYNSARFSPEPRWDLRWTLGARIATVYYDTNASNAAINDSESNYFYGAGIHGGGEVRRQFSILPSFSLFAKADAAFLVGQINQNFYENNTDTLGNTFSGTSQYRKSQSVQTLNLQTGVSYTPSSMEYLRFSAGYELEYWFNVGNLGDSHGDLATQGIFLRGQFDF